MAAQPPVDLRTANASAVLAGSAITNTGPSIVYGDLGLTPGSSVSGFPPGAVNGTISINDAVARSAQSDLTAAYNGAAGRTPALSVPSDLGGMTVTRGVFSTGSSLRVTGTLTLDGQNDPDSVFVFKAGSSLTTASGSRIALINGAQVCNVFWQVGSSATLGSGSAFSGTLMALTSISAQDGVSVRGRALARNGAVTLINDTVTRVPCAPGTVGGDGGAPIPPTVPGSTPPGGTPPGSTPPGSTPPGSTPPTTPSFPTDEGTALLRTTPRSVGNGTCVSRDFQVSVEGVAIGRVRFSIGGRQIAVRSAAPFRTTVRVPKGTNHTVFARVAFTDGTPPTTLRLRFRRCAQAGSRPPRIPVGVTG